MWCAERFCKCFCGVPLKFLTAMYVAVITMILTFAFCFIMKIFDDYLGWVFANPFTSSASLAASYSSSFALHYYIKNLVKKK